MKLNLFNTTSFKNPRGTFFEEGSLIMIKYYFTIALMAGQPFLQINSKQLADGFLMRMRIPSIVPMTSGKPLRKVYYINCTGPVDIYRKRPADKHAISKIAFWACLI